jgi:uncharacterized SAM-binding protein YcdF (DUF218 family)
VIGSLIQLLVLPPMNILVALTAALILRWRAGAFVCLALLWLFALPAFSGSLIALLERGLHPAGSANPAGGAAPEACVFVSGDQQESLVDHSGGRGAAEGMLAVPAALTLEREQEGAALARQTGLPILVSGGVIRRGSRPLAVQMAASLKADFGREVTWVEDKSLDTWGNARESAAILKAAGVRSVYLVTHAWHMRRAMLAFRRAGLVVVPAPVLIDVKPPVDWKGFTPSAKGWLESYYACHELIGLAWYALRP